MLHNIIVVVVVFVVVVVMVFVVVHMFPQAIPLAMMTIRIAIYGYGALLGGFGPLELCCNVFGRFHCLFGRVN